MVKFTNDIIIVVNEHLKIVESNYKAQEIYGYLKEELVKMDIFALHANDVIPELARKIEILKNEWATFFETINKRKDGSEFHVEFTARKFEVGEKTFYQFLGHDISDRKQLEDELNRIFSLVPDMICIISADGYLKELNPAWEKILGYTNHELLSKPYTDFIHPDDLSSTIEQVEKHLNGQYTGSFINRYLCKDGSYKWFDWVANPSPDGKLLFAAARDITARKQAEDEREAMINLLRLLNSKSSLQDLLQSVVSFLKDLTKSEAIGIRLRNGDDYPYTEYSGFSKEFIMNENYLLAKDINGNLQGDQNEGVLLECCCGDILQKKYDSNKPNYTAFGSFWTHNLSLQVKNGFRPNSCTKTRNSCFKQGYESMILVPLHMGGEIFGLIQFNDKRKNLFPLPFISFLEKLGEYIAIAIIQRISQEELIEGNLNIQKINKELIAAKEKAEESDRLKSAFLANMSHEIRTPMNAVIGFTEILLKPDLPANKKERFASLIKQRSQDLLRIIEDVLDISKLEAGQMKMIENDISLSILMNEIYEYYRLKKEKLENQSELTLKLSIDPELKQSRIKSDSLRLKQILNNLLDNAFKFTSKGYIEFGCRLESKTKITFFVKDTGIGIPLNKQKIIFDPFRQAEDLVFTRQYGGVGLGLSIVKGMVNLMKGKIWVDSKPNEGTTFFVTVPYISGKMSVENSPDIIQKTANWQGKTLLIVEDDEANSAYLNEILSDFGLTILNAFNGEEALQLFNDRPDINIVLMDIRLPDTNGLTLTRIFKKDRPEINIIAQTAYAAPEDIEECFSAGCDDYVSKPINKKKLLLLLSRFLSNSQQSMQPESQEFKN
jgi:PAS domain S-box-containing protein